MAQRKNGQTKTPQVKAAQNTSSGAGKRQGQGAKAAQSASSKAPAKPAVQSKPAAKSAGQNSKSSGAVNARAQQAARPAGANARGQRSERTAEVSSQPQQSEAKRKEHDSDIKKIFKTTDGQFTGRSDITKPRNVAVMEQREDDGALALVKIYSKKKKKGKSFIRRLVLKPKKHTALTEDSIVGTRVIVGIEIKTENGKEFKPIFKGDLTATDDELTDRELKKVRRGAGGRTKKNKQTLKEKIAKWRNHFK